MEPSHRIDVARAVDVPALAAIERAAARLLEGHAPAAVLDEVTDAATLRRAAEEGRLWIARVDGVPVGFALVAMLAPDMPHLEEVGVHPEHGRRGIGAALVRAACAWVARAGHRELTLTTFRAVPWNMPFYAKLGFVDVTGEPRRPELGAVVDDEAARGLDPASRVVMRWRPGDRDPAGGLG